MTTPDLRSLLGDHAPERAVCAYHPEVAAIRTCQRCGSFICEGCRSTRTLTLATTTCTTCANLPDPVVIRGRRIVLAICIGQMLLILGSAPYIPLLTALMKISVSAFLCWHTFHGERSARAVFVALLAMGAAASLYRGTTNPLEGVFIALAVCFALVLSLSPSVNAFFRASWR